MTESKDFSAEAGSAKVVGTVSSTDIAEPVAPPMGLRAMGPRITFHFVGEWDAETSYALYDVVRVNGTSYIANKINIAKGINPETDNNAHWVKWNDPNAQVELLQQTVNGFDARITAAEADATAAAADAAAAKKASADNATAIAAETERATVAEANIAESSAKSYSSVAAMQADSSLKKGMVVRTNGFHSQNDGGSAWYAITENETANGMDVIACANGVFAVLIDDEKDINIMQYGADSTGATDASGVFQYVIDKVRSGFIANGLGTSPNTIIIPAGRYKIESTITLSPYAKLKTSGYAVIEANVSDAPVFLCTHSAGDPTSTSYSREFDYLRGNWIDGSQGLLIKNSGTANEGIAFEIGSRTNLGEYLPTCIYTVKNAAIQDFKVGIKFNTYNNYVATVDGFDFENQEIAVQYGDSSHSTNENSGEKIMFYNCLFSGNRPCFAFHSSGFDTYCVGCSFDFNRCIAKDYVSNGYRTISFSECHFEATGVPDSGEVANTPHGFYLTIGNETKIMMSNCDYYRNRKKSFYMSKSSNSARVFLSISNVYFEDSSDLSYSENYNAVSGEIFVTNYSGLSILDVNHRFLGNSQNLAPAFISGSGTTVTGMSASDNSNCTYTVSAENPIIGADKSIKITRTSSTSNWAQFFDVKFEAVPFGFYALNCATYDCKNTTIPIKWYDRSGTLISETSGYHASSSIPDDEWYMSNLCVTAIAPRNAAYGVAQFQFEGSQNTAYIGGTFIEKL